MLNNKPNNKPLELSMSLKQVLRKYRESLKVTDVMLINDSIRLLNEVGNSPKGVDHKFNESKVVMNVLMLLLESSNLKGIINNL